MFGQKDAGGMTRDEVSKLTLQQEFELNAQRYVHFEEVLRDAQLQISSGVWDWAGGETLPEQAYNGGVGGGLPGANGHNSYYVKGTRIILPPGKNGDVADLDPVRGYFEQKGWKYFIRKYDGAAEIWGITGDGYRVKYMIQDNGQYSISVYSELFWSNDAKALFWAVAERDNAEFPNESLPGVWAAFPKWDDPVHPKILGQ
ncbi:hypothetical protein C5C66_01590 [Rathayibacter toxicus]|uniref:Uncharacterized protein n=2 Tax=Rathayibacter toxicus TaxID=145458 RepID=A0A0C5BDN6_9MICO|nr:hypothetical protein [Rathayibacter toxicus]AJM77039.1 hypothetical protein TI83_01785 [Rathayibacter toxicus]ALS57151.1 hypothetical protein APU90_04705 [Rathayibacter toxicus]KKM46041.1 hypothetical protein VT73_02800 [Rathayibacter toxicus]PPG22973.1 hypothetical protein C5D15_01565 [Rathayibacter toxicus]PPG47554.1 hypothetical protein C5D16_01555 [Rathayibacter toxicus]